MRTWTWPLRAVLPLLAVLAATPAAFSQQLYTQTVPLRPGWNAVYLEVTPDPADIASVFSAASCGGMPVPLASIWTYDPSFGSVSTPPDPSSGLRGETGWFGWYPPTSPESLLNNLYSVSVNTPYLVNLGGTNSVTCNITGIPKLRPRRWIPDSFNLTGFAVDPQGSPSFGAYLQPSTAHDGQAIFRLTTSGTWVPVLPYLEPIRSGESYWVYTAGSSDYQGPLEIDLLATDRLEFGVTTSEITVEATNKLDIDTVLSIQAVTGPAVPLLYEKINQLTSGRTWMPMASQGQAFDLPADSRVLVDLAPDRDQIADRTQNIVSVTNGLGVRILLLAGANTPGSGTPTSEVTEYIDDIPGGLPPTSGNPYAGLWVGVAKVRAVEEVRCVPEPRGTCVTGGASCESDDDCGTGDTCDNGCGCQVTGTCDVTGSSCSTFTDCPLLVESCVANSCNLTGISCSADIDCPGGTQQCLSNLINPGDALLCGSACVAGGTCVCPERDCVLPRSCGVDACVGDRTQSCVSDGDCIDMTAGSTPLDLGPCRPATCFTDADCPTAASCGPDISTPMPTGQEFRMRLLVHVDGAGQATLLKEVIQLFRDATYGPDPALPGFNTPIDTGNFVLITDDERIVDFEGIALRGGVRVGQRISTVAYDYDDSSPGWDPGSKGIQMGTFDPSTNSTITAQLAMPRALPTNPYQHRFHPDLNGLDENGLPLGFCQNDPQAPLGPTCVTDLDCITATATPVSGGSGVCADGVATTCTVDVDCTGAGLAGPCVDASDTGPCLEKQGQEVPAIGRTIDLTFDLAAYPDFCPDGCPNDNTCSDTPSPPTTCPCDCEQRPADWGAAVVGGTYVESVTGLHRIPIQASGVFELRRVSDTAELNPQP
jgi:hypothetical protein